jgi:hypothetical protein
MLDYTWLTTKDGDPRVAAIYRRHYSCYKYADGRRNQKSYRNRNQVIGPGQKMVLITPDCKAIFGWRKFIDDSGQIGINCAFFRNEGALNGMLSSEMILAAERLAWARWPGERLYTYVNTRAVNGDGACFKHAGWKKCGRSKKRDYLILEKHPNGS